MDYENITLSGVDATGKKKNYSLNDFKGEQVVLYFYPKDETSLCTQEACAFRDSRENLPKDTLVIGVSPDDTDSHLRFHKREGLNFILLSDTDGKLADAFGVKKQKNGYLNRSTFVLDKNGKIVKGWSSVDVNGHADEVIATLQ